MKKLVFAALVTFAFVALVSGAAPSNLTYPGNVTIRKTTIDNIQYGLFDAGTNAPIGQVDFGTVEPGSSKGLALELISTTAEGVVYVAWHVNQPSPYMLISAYTGVARAVDWNMTERRGWDLSQPFVFTLLLRVDADAPALDNVSFQVSFALFTTPQ